MSFCAVLLLLFICLFVFQVLGIAALACGMISVACCNGDVTSTILQTMMERSEADLKDTFARYLALGLALNYLGKAYHSSRLEGYPHNIFLITPQKHMLWILIRSASVYLYIHNMCSC